MARVRLAALLITMAAAQTFMQRREIPVLKAPQEPEIPRLTPELPTHVGLLDELERLVERRERAMERTSWALGMLCVVALTSAGLSARSMLRNKAD